MAAENTDDTEDSRRDDESAEIDGEDPLAVPPEEMPDEDDERVIPKKDPEEVLEMNTDPEDL
jgi:hypothetical protein